MKKVILLAGAFLFLTGLHAQENVTLQQGAVLEYYVLPGGGFLKASLVLERVSTDTIVISWETHDRSGRRTMAASSIENSRLGYWSPPINGEDLLIPADQSMLTISRANFRELKRVGIMQFDGQHFTLTRSLNFHYMANGKKLNAIRADAPSGSRLWILDSENLPLILKYEGNPYNVDIELTSLN